MDKQERFLIGRKEDFFSWEEFSMAGLISEEEVPSLYSLSLTDSVCSSSTVDVEAVEENHSFSPYDFAQEFHSSPLENNFMQEKVSKSSEIHQSTAVETSMDLTNSFNNTSRNCISLHDVSNLTPIQIPTNSTNAVSCETIHSQSLSSTTKSKDSGFQRSVSCLSLNCGKRNYDHVESKVKAYIRNIKESEALRKKNILAQKAIVVSEPTSIVELDSDLDKEDLLLQVQELKEELHEKALFIDTQQRNYNSLLLKLAEAKNTINALRVQRISLNYNSTIESNTTKKDNIDLGVFEEEINRQQEKLSKNMSMSAGSKLSDNKSTGASPNNSLLDTFKPKYNSTPSKKDPNNCLSPVSKMFSSSSRLDKDFKPLGNLKKQRKSNMPFQNNVRPNTVSQYLGEKVNNSSAGSLIDKSKKTVLKSSGLKKSTSFCDKNQHNTNIDLPNVDPFDKVKKWQASLPTINLIDQLSSSDCDPLEESRIPSKLPGNSENEINCSLSLELMSKLKISDEPLKSSSCVNIAMYRKEKMSLNLNNFSNKKAEVNFERKKGQVDSSKRELGRFSSKSENADGCQTNSQQFAGSSNLSASESDSQTCLPKSSSWTQTSERPLKNDSLESNDDSSSDSSSIWSSKESSSMTSLKISSCKLLLRKSKTETNVRSKSLKITQANTKVVLQKPKLNYEPMANISNFKNDKLKKIHSPKNSTNNLKSLRVESSQRKAWNERNSTNFYVCKEFKLKRSSSLQECLNIMQNMVEEGSSIIESTLERSHCH